MNIDAVLKSLATQRPIFHSEADFQHALAWTIHTLFPHTAIRLEYPIKYDSRQDHIDLWLTHEEHRIAIELKYLSRSITLTTQKETFRLSDHSAQDQRR